MLGDLVIYHFFDDLANETIECFRFEVAPGVELLLFPDALEAGYKYFSFEHVRVHVRPPISFDNFNFTGATGRAHL